MPLDLTPPAPQSRTALYRERRERAAELLRAIPAVALDMEQWTCSSKACALGWIASFGLDGWWLDVDEGDGDSTPCWQGKDGYEAAADYFGLPESMATLCFGWGDDTIRFHGRWYRSRLTPSDVAATLLRLPVVGE